MTDVFTEVQAVMLNSETEPREAVTRALEAVASFAVAEGLPIEFFVNRARLTYSTQEAKAG